MRHIGTTRTAVAVLLLAVASFASSGAGESPSAEVALAATKQRDPKPVTLTWGGDLTLGSSYGNPPNGGRALLAAGSKLLKRADIAAVKAHPQTQALGILQPNPGYELEGVGLPISFDGARPAVRQGAPALGEANAEYGAPPLPPPL